MIIILLLVVIVILLFGASAVKSAVSKLFLFMLALVCIPIFMVVLGTVPWYVLIPAIILFIVFVAYTSKKTKQAEPDATISLLPVGKYGYVKIQQEDRYVVLLPTEAACLVYKWEEVKRYSSEGQLYKTSHGTTFRVVQAGEMCEYDPILTKSLINKGMPFFVEIRQFNKYSIQTNHCLHLNPMAVLNLERWLENAVKTEPLVRNYLQGVLDS
ncbi:hypothetical protein SAMN04487897_109129 [Paenibacillus sp. yr247]|uniref:hypothetical protein n=1 Tax=Paenibacillus sp. yr247 TaxID=1761880 RepID=UPI00088C714C|nr:hypothetical protein [Paenibacillus sp. yr247]SDO18194.1 hypothetical protein SAMN04487897_109129 [Paenibacillus sp. yr247]